MVQVAVQKELNGPGKLLGYRELNQKLRMFHEVQVPQNLTLKMLQNKDSDRLELCHLSSKKK